MILNDIVQVDSLEVPPGQHIKAFYIKSGQYIFDLGFETNKGQRFGLLTDSDPRIFDLENIVGPNDQYYIDGIRGKTVTSRGSPCICEVEFKYVIFPSAN